MLKYCESNGIISDRAKGIVTKEFPKHWTSYNHINDGDSEELKKKKKLFNNILIERKPYFFKNRYAKDKNMYNNYMEGRDIYSQVTFGMPIDKLREKENKTEEEINFIQSVDRFCPLVDSDCEMNNLSKYMNNYEYNLKKKLKSYVSENVYLKYMSDKINIDMDIYKKVKQAVVKYFKQASEISACSYKYDAENTENVVNDNYESLKTELYSICSNTRILTEYMVLLFYTDLTGKNKNVLWKLCGKYMYQNVLSKVNEYKIPVITHKHEYDFQYLNKNYILKSKRID